jgi:hypothetical protein
MSPVIGYISTNNLAMFSIYMIIMLLAVAFIHRSHVHIFITKYFANFLE